MKNYDFQQEPIERLWPMENDLFDEELEIFLDGLFKDWEEELGASRS